MKLKPERVSVQTLLCSLEFVIFNNLEPTKFQTWLTVETSQIGTFAFDDLFRLCPGLSCSSELAQLVPLPYSRGRSTRYSDRLHDFSVTIPRCYKDVYVISFFPRTARLWNSLPIEYFPLIYDLSGFKSRINRYLLTVGSF